MPAKSLQKIVFVGVTLESALALVYCLWAYYRQSAPPFNITLNTSCFGLLIPLPILVLNILLFCTPLRHAKVLESSNRFIINVVKPFIGELTIPAALVISIAAGIGEELFFRGMLVSEVGLIISSILFSVLHFGTTVKEFRFMAFLYFLIGIYFGYVLKTVNSLWAICEAHAFYDFVVIVFLKHYWKKC